MSVSDAPADSRAVRLAHALGVRDAGRVLRDFATYLPTQAIPALAGFLVLPFLARKLSSTEVGVLAIAQTLVTLGWTVVGSWLAAAIIRELPAAEAAGAMRGFARTLAKGAAAVLGALLVFVGGLALLGTVSAAISDNLVLIAAATAGLVAQNLAVSLFAARLRPRAYALVEVTARVGGISIGTALVFAGHGVRGYLTGLATASIVIGVAGLLVAWPRGEGGTNDRVELAPWLRYGVPASTGAVAVWGLAFVDRYILAALKDAGTVGVYTVGNALGDRVIMVPMFAFAAASSPLLITAYERHGRHEVERLMRAYTRVVLVIGVACLAFVAAEGRDIVELLTGRHFF
jgi:O-antigen/teichoic acid export membrane protein